MSSPPLRFSWEKQLVASEIGKAARAVGLVMAIYSNKDGGSIHPGIDRLARESGYEARSVRRAIEELSAAGFIVQVQSSNGRGGRATEYRLTIPAASERNPWAQAESGHRAIGGHSRPSLADIQDPLVDIPASLVDIHASLEDTDVPPTDHEQPIDQSKDQSMSENTDRTPVKRNAWARVEGRVAAS